MEIVSADNIEHLKSAEKIHSGELSKKIEHLLPLAFMERSS
jgi:hypothetical protein